MNTMRDLAEAVNVAKRLWKCPERRDRVIQSLIRNAARNRQPKCCDRGMPFCAGCPELNL